MWFVTDLKRHLICFPYSIEGLHKMAGDLNINKCWFHSKGNRSHYDIPKKRVKEIKSKCIIVSSKEILRIMENTRMTKNEIDFDTWSDHFYNVLMAAGWYPEAAKNEREGNMECRQDYYNDGLTPYDAYVEELKDY